ncbi:MAG: SMC-Scp complex subunit ScpB [Gammaproteobacteria bacterium]
MSTNQPPIKDIIEAALLCADQPLNLERLAGLFDEDARPAPEEIRTALDELAREWGDRTLELKEVSSGFRLQVRQRFAPWVGRLAEERAPRYSRALLETLALIVYRQPITRAGIEEIRGVSVSTHIIRTLMEREWIRVVGYRDVPGKPALYGTTRKFLDYFNIQSLSDLPALADIRPIDHLQKELDLAAAANAAESSAPDAGALYAMEPAMNDAGPDAAEEDEAEARETAEALN